MKWNSLKISESCALHPLDKIVNHGFGFCLNYEILIAMFCKKYLQCALCGEKLEQMEGALSMRLGPVIEWGRRIKRGGVLEGNLEGVDTHLQPRYWGDSFTHTITILRNEYVQLCTLVRCMLGILGRFMSSWGRFAWGRQSLC